MTPAWPWALALTIALGALIVSQVQLREAHAETRRLRPAVRRDPVGPRLGAVGMSPIRWSDVAETALGVVLGLAIGATALAALGNWVVKRVWA